MAVFTDEAPSTLHRDPGARRLVVLVGVVAAPASPRFAASTSCRPRCSRPTSAAAWSSDDENDQSRHRRSVRRAALHRRQAARSWAAHRRRRHQRAAGGPQAAGRAGPRSTTCLPSRSCSTCRSGLRTSATASARTATSARHVVRQQRRSCAVARGTWARGLPRRPRAARAERGRRRGRSSAQPLWTDRRERARPVRHHRRRPRLLRRARRRCSATLGYADRPGRRRSAPPPRRAASGLRRRPRRPRPRHARRAAPGDGHGRRRPALCVPGNHENKLVRALAGANVQISHGLAESLAQLAAEPAEFRDAGRTSSSTACVAHLVLDDGKLVVAHAGLTEDDAGPGLGRGPRLRALRRHHRRDRRVRPARPLPLGRRTTAARRRSSTATRPCPSRTGSTTRSASTPAACSAASSPRCASPSGSWCRSRPRRSTTSRPARCAEPPRAASSDGHRPTARHRATCSASGSSTTRLAGTRHRPRGERRRRPRGDEPLRRRPALAGLPAADHGACRDRSPTAACSSIPTRRSPTIARDGVDRRSCARRSTWARGPSSSSAATLTPSPRSASASPTASAGVDRTPAPDGRSSTDAGDEPRCSAGVRAAAHRRRTLGRAARPTGSVLDCELLPWSAKAGDSFAANTRRSALLPRATLTAAAARPDQAAAGRGLDLGGAAANARRAARDGRPHSSRPTDATAGPSTSIDDLRARPVPDARRRGQRPRTQPPPLAPRPR